MTFASFVGMLDAGYLTYEKLTHQTPGCGAGFDCSGVLNSPWASIGPVPLSAIGLLFYLTVYVICVLSLVGITLPKWGQPTIWQNFLHFFTRHADVPNVPYLITLGTMGLVFSLFLIFLMGVVIQAWCLYCLISALVSSALFLFSLGIRHTARHDS